MNTKSVTISNEDWQRINDILSKDSFKNVDNITIENSGSIGGLGSILTVSFDFNIDDTIGRFSTKIYNEENW